MRRKKYKYLHIVVPVILVIFAVAAVSASRYVYDNYIPNFRGQSGFYVYPGATLSQVVAAIEENVGVKSCKSLERVLRREFEDTAGLHPGYYMLDGTNTSAYAARMLRFGWQTPVNLVLSGSIRSKASLARKISRQMLVDSAAVVSALSDTAFLSAYGVNPENVFAIIMPDTYQMYWTDSMARIMDKQKAEYDRFWTRDNVAKASSQGLTPLQVGILASIVRGESNYVPEYPKIAAVYLNRLHRGMKLQADPTIAYCFDYEPNRILKSHLQVESPYNTYKYKGLPPGPICVPGKDAMNAVLNPASGGDLYFCASSALDGTHLFAATYAAHLRNAAAFRKAITKKLRQKATN